MAVQPIGGISAATTVAPTGATAPADAARRVEAQSKDSTTVIGRVTRTREDGSTVTTTTYADGHTKIETTPPKFFQTESTEAESNGPESTGTKSTGTEAQGSDGGGRVTAVDLLA